MASLSNGHDKKAEAEAGEGGARNQLSGQQNSGGARNGRASGEVEHPGHGKRHKRSGSSNRQPEDPLVLDGGKFGCGEAFGKAKRDIVQTIAIKVDVHDWHT